MSYKITRFLYGEIINSDAKREKEIVVKDIFRKEYNNYLYEYLIQRREQTSFIENSQSEHAKYFAELTEQQDSNKHAQLALIAFEILALPSEDIRWFVPCGEATNLSPNRHHKLRAQQEFLDSDAEFNTIGTGMAVESMVGKVESGVLKVDDVDLENEFDDIMELRPASKLTKIIHEKTWDKFIINTYPKKEISKDWEDSIR
ncbi:hypothetical protein C2G38_2244965, partial [Gigaspora rosea]